METFETTDPLPPDEDGYCLTVGLTYNLKKGIKSEVEDIEAEYDSIDTVIAIKEALESFGCRVELLEADAHLFEKLTDSSPDIVFNIAEGTHGRGREAQVPSILNFLNIPFAGSDETTLCIALDKALSKRILSTYKIKTPKYRLSSGNKPVSVKGLQFPLIVKPNAEGSSKGISDVAVVENPTRLKELLAKNTKAYSQPMLVEEFIPGKELTVAIVGNGEETVVYPPMEIKYIKSMTHNIYSFSVKKNYKEYIEYDCPAALEISMEKTLKNTAKKIYQVLECKDFARMDFRISEEGEIYFIEINPLPGLAPSYSDYPMITEFVGMDYRSTIKSILNSALKRYGIKPVV
ncbi:MAG: ATP-grasp domain-containing protein [Ruminiclostridium sp.]|nr:ATP-grasp domain-containing protein [Ruminiclostridium sp.]